MSQKPAREDCILLWDEEGGQSVRWKVSHGDLENLERRLIALLYALWRIQGRQKKIVKVDGSNA